MYTLRYPLPVFYMKKCFACKDKVLHIKHRKREPEGIYGHLGGCNRNLPLKADVAKASSSKGENYGGWKLPVANFFVGHKFPPGEKSSLTRPFLPPGDKIVCNADALAGTFSPGEKLCKIRRVKYPRQIKSNSLGNFSLGGISSWESACYTGWGKIPPPQWTPTSRSNFNNR